MRAIEPAGKVMGIALGMLIGADQSEREKIKKILQEAYSIRNAEVHGNVEQLKQYSPKIDKIRTQLESYIRRTLKKLVEE